MMAGYLKINFLTLKAPRLMEKNFKKLILTIEASSRTSLSWNFLESAGK